MFKSSLVAAILLAGAAGYAHAGTPSVVGTWRWFNPAGSSVYFNPNGTAQHMVSSKITDHGVWKEGTAGNVDITWSSGYVDHWQISQDGSTMTGHNSDGPTPTITRER
ncbi:MAG TPA: hypothetical protein VHW60_00845 [Caulobacteraceae bacterium]|nr:hypothetical protein [Caulobacteraceae bacterium]